MSARSAVPAIPREAFADVADEYGKALAALLLERPRLVSLCRCWEDLGAYVDENEFYGEVDAQLGWEMPDTVAECEARYYPMLNAATDVAAAIVWPRA